MNDGEGPDSNDVDRKLTDQPTAMFQDLASSHPDRPSAQVAGSEKRKHGLGYYLVVGFFIFLILGLASGAWWLHGLVTQMQAPPPPSTPGAEPSTVVDSRVMGLAMRAMGANPKLKPSAPQNLKNLMPQTFAGYSRMSVDDSREQWGPIEFTGAIGKYAAADGGLIAIEICDAAAFAGIFAKALSSGGSDVHQETAAGYTRSVKYKGCVGTEEYVNATRTGSMKLLAHQRFLVEVTGKGIDAETLRVAFDAVDLVALGKLR